MKEGTQFEVGVGGKQHEISYTQFLGQCRLLLKKEMEQQHGNQNNLTFLSQNKPRCSEKDRLIGVLISFQPLWLLKRDLKDKMGSFVIYL